ncbi:MAG TPA: SemiSWEET family transporter [Patescibacteria group bacterium]|nr:SemiSWEET family transporter [Patescibacteria group bacterium]
MEIIGAIAGVLTVFGFVPQAIKTIRSRKTSDLSLHTYLILTTSGTLWVIYGVMIKSPSIWVTNSIVAFLCATVLVLKLQE